MQEPERVAARLGDALKPGGFYEPVAVDNLRADINFTTDQADYLRELVPTYGSVAAVGGEKVNTNFEERADHQRQVEGGDDGRAVGP